MLFGVQLVAYNLTVQKVLVLMCDVIMLGEVWLFEMHVWTKILVADTRKITNSEDGVLNVKSTQNDFFLKQHDLQFFLFFFISSLR